MFGLTKAKIYMARIENNKVPLGGSHKAAGFTYYQKNGKTIMRLAFSDQPERRTKPQFVTRQRLAHNNLLWRAMKAAGATWFEGGASPYHRFCTLMTPVKVGYLTKEMVDAGATLLLPGMVLSDGPLDEVGYRLGTVYGRPALVTDLKAKSADVGSLWLCTVRQEVVNGVPRVRVSVESELKKYARTAKGFLALVDERFGDEMAGFGLVRVVDGHASQQRLVTRCRHYMEYTTDEALQAAAKSYGGLTNSRRLKKRK